MLPDRSVVLASRTITAAITGLPSDEISLGGFDRAAACLAVQCKLTYGSGGTTAKAYVQTSLDGGSTWVDIMSFAFTTSTATKVSAVTTAVAASAAITPTDGTLTDNTIVNGIIGDRVRVKMTTTGTYAGSTTMVLKGCLR